MTTIKLQQDEITALSELVHAGAIYRAGTPQYLAPFVMLIQNELCVIDANNFFVATDKGRKWMAEHEAHNGEPSPVLIVGQKVIIKVKPELGEKIVSAVNAGFIPSVPRYKLQGEIGSFVANELVLSSGEMTPSEIDQTLIEAGYDPRQLGKEMADFARRQSTKAEALEIINQIKVICQKQINQDRLSFAPDWLMGQMESLSTLLEKLQS